MRRALVRWQLVAPLAGRRRPSQPRGKHAQFPAQAREIIGKLQHHFVLLGDVVLQIRDLLFQMSDDVLAHGFDPLRRAVGPDCRSWLSSGITTRV